MQNVVILKKLPLNGLCGRYLSVCGPESRTPPFTHTVRKIDLILRPLERRPQMQFSMARKFKLQLLRRYSVKISKMRNFTLGMPGLGKLKNTG
jgi:hypothetical protein